MNSNRYVVKVAGRWGILSDGSAMIKDLFDTQEEAIKASPSICIPINLQKKKPNSKTKNVFDISLYE